MLRLLLPAAIALACAVTLPAQTKAKPNVLFIAIDDQNDWIGHLGGHPQVQTPHIDALAARGMAFTNAHCQAPLCNPSRSSLLTGLRPSSTGIYGLAPGIREVAQTEQHVTLPQTFTSAGYFTFNSGKIYHGGSIRPQDQAREFTEWAGRAATGGKGKGKGQAKAKGQPSNNKAKPPVPIAKLDIPGRHPAMDWGVWPEHDEDTPDYIAASAAIDALARVPAEQPFFIACGLILPHVPCYAPQRWFDLYPDASLAMPPVKEDDRADLPKFADFLHWKLPEPRLKTLRDLNEWRPLVRAYLASTSLMDSQVGRLLSALEKSGRADNTIIVLWSDHGWHLGEKLITGKNTLWERSTRVPLIFAGPGIASGKCARPAELLDIFPTLLDLCEMPARNDLEGHSLLPQLKDAQAPRQWPAITTHNQGNHSIRSEDWRYIRYADGSEELYDEKADPNEWTNLAKDPKHTAKKAELAKWLPQIDKAPVPGSKSRVLTFDKATGEVIWEEKPVDKSAPLPGDY
jgi:arylsulfatase A-like enzyme